MDLKTMLNQVLSESGFLQEDEFANSTDPDNIQMVAMANRVAKYVRDYYPWMTNRATATINLVSGTTTYSLPSDFRGIVPNTGWMDDGAKPIDLPTNDDRWYQLKYSSLSAGGIVRCKLNGDEIEVDDDFADGDSFSFAYYTENVITDSGGTPKELFTADTDLFTLDDELLIYGVNAMWHRTKRMPSYQELQGEFHRKLNSEIARTSGAKTAGGCNTRVIRRSPYYPLWQS